MAALSATKSEMSNLQADMQHIKASHATSAQTVDELRHELDAKRETVQTLELTVQRLQASLERSRRGSGGGGGSGSNGAHGVHDSDSLRKELAHKDRQIESLEEQLRRNTSAEIQRLKRGSVASERSEHRTAACNYCRV